MKTKKQKETVVGFKETNLFKNDEIIPNTIEQIVPVVGVKKIKESKETSHYGKTQK